MSYGRENPSPRYAELLEQYENLHREGNVERGLKPEHTFSGTSLFSQASRIKTLFDQFQIKTVLDYGAGKGQQYIPRTINVEGVDRSFNSIAQYWDVEPVVCYDPCYEPFRQVPEGKFDAVISTDMLEHCPEEDVPWVIEEFFKFANKLVFANIASYPAEKTLPNGENAHCTIKPKEWWQNLIESIASRYPDINYEFIVTYQEVTPRGYVYTDDRIDNFNAA
jgi:2-polyprenyl-3-methyl-5-hydroxy-6-metoxy-1,4-benzoquinol methylase